MFFLQKQERKEKGPDSYLLGFFHKAPGSIARHAARIQSFIDSFYLASINLHSENVPVSIDGYERGQFRIISPEAMSSAIIIKDKLIYDLRRVFNGILTFDTYDKCDFYFFFFFFF